MRNPSWLAICLALVPALRLAGQEPPPAIVATPQELIAEGVSLHDAGKYDDAIRNFQSALAIEPDNAEALYELAGTYAVTRRYDLCEATASQALQKPGRLEAPLFAIVGSCLSSAGKTRKALRTFEKGLAGHPDDPTLNFNIAVTLMADGKGRKAVPHLERAIEARPFYGSPYLGLGEILAGEGRSVEAIWYFLRFVSLEVNSERAAPAAARVFDLLTSGVSAKGENEVTISLHVDDADDVSGLEFARAIAAASMHLEEARTQSEAQRHVAALHKFVKMAEEMKPDEKGNRDVSAFGWRRAAQPILRLEAKGAFECFGYLLAQRVGLEGAQEWLEQNAAKVRELEAALAELIRPASR